MKPTETQTRWFRLRRSGLVEPFESPETAASVLAGVQAQILPAAGLSLWNRTAGLTNDAFEARLYRERSLVKLWGQRGTLHLYPSSEWPLIFGAMGSESTWREKRIVRQGGDVAAFRAAIARVADLLCRHGTLGRSDLRRAVDLNLDESLLSPWGGVFQELVHAGLACHAGRQGSEGRFAHREHWLPDLEWNPPPADEANTVLARSYLRAYGPAAVQDFHYWRGGRVAIARRAVAALGNEVAEVEVEVNGRPMLVLRGDLEELNETPPPPEVWPVRMLYRFDPLMLGIKDKKWLVDMQYYKQVWRTGGHIEGTVLAHGRIAGVWRYKRTGSDLRITVAPFVPLPAHVRTAVEEQAAGVARFFGLPLGDLTVNENVQGHNARRH